jgi:hypothetical protein
LGRIYADFQDVKNMIDKVCIFTDYLKYRAELRGFDLAKIEHILRYSQERYVDSDSYRFVVIGDHNQKLVMIPYEENDTTITPITIHATTRQQIKFRLTTGRLTHE